MQRQFRFLVVVIGLSSISLSASHAAKHEDSQAEKFVQDIANQGFQIIDNPDWAPDRKREEFRRLMGRHIAFRFFGRSALGPFARIPSKGQFDAYVKLLQNYAAYSMQSQLNEYTGQAIRVLSSRVKDSKRISFVSVDSEVYSRSSGRIEGTAKWLLIRRLNEDSHSDAGTADGIKNARAELAASAGAEYKVYDLVLQTAGESASFSLLQTQRDEFTAILTKNRRDFDTLLNYIQEQIRKIQESD